jgi:hypothetical protein
MTSWEEMGVLRVNRGWGRRYCFSFCFEKREKAWVWRD